MVNATGFLGCQRFVSHVTGTVTMLGVNAGRLSVLAFEFALVLGCFILGAMASVFAIQGRARRGKKPLHALPLLLVAIDLGVVALLGHADMFGHFGAATDTVGDFAMLSSLSFGMGLQNASVATSTGLLVRTTHLTGPSTDFGVGMAMSLITEGKERSDVLRSALLRGGKVLSFAFGAALAIPLCARLEYLTLALPAAGVLAATLLSFRGEDPTP